MMRHSVGDEYDAKDRRHYPGLKHDGYFQGYKTPLSVSDRVRALRVERAKG
jgi:hypothetical protein